MAVEGGDGKPVEAVRINGFEFHIKGGNHTLNLDMNEAGFGGLLSAE